MAQQPIAGATPGSREPTPDSAAPLRDPRERIVEALFSLLPEKRWDRVGLSDIAERAGVTLAELRILFPSKGAVVAGYVRKIDLAVLSDKASDMAGEPTRERLFDVLMRRFEAMAPDREALRAIRDGLMADPMGAAAMNQVSVSSMQWMLAAAGVPESGPLGTARAQGLALIMARVFPTFLADPDEGLARTMKALDEELRRAERLMRRADDFGRIAAPLREAFGRIIGRGAPRRRPGDDDMAAA